MPFNRIVVIGAGTMGAGIAQVCAAAGYETVLFDIKKSALPKAIARINRNLDKAIAKGKTTPNEKAAILQRIDTSTLLGDLRGDFIIEAIYEDFNIKMEVLQQVARMNNDDVILASNTSSITITRLAAKLPNPERVIGMHFFNPAPIMPLVEVVSGRATNAETQAKAILLTEKMGKTAVAVKDTAGFIVNRINRHYYAEALKLLEEGVADMQTIDELLRATNFNMGAFELMDLIGLDINFTVSQRLHQSFFGEARFRPSQLQQQMVQAGHLGRKVGKGFYDYDVPK